MAKVVSYLKALVPSTAKLNLYILNILFTFSGICIFIDSLVKIYSVQGANLTRKKKENQMSAFRKKKETIN